MLESIVREALVQADHAGGGHSIIGLSAGGSVARSAVGAWQIECFELTHDDTEGSESREGICNDDDGAS